MGSPSAVQQPKVAAVVVTWNDVEMASECVRSLRASDYPNLHIILVDNGSEEPCGQRVKQQHPTIDLVVLPRNRGFTGGSNAGLVRGVEAGADYVQLYNNDIVVEPSTVSLMVEAFDRHPGLGAASPLLLTYDPEDKTERVRFYRGDLDREHARHDHQWAGVQYASRDWPDVESPFVPFCATMFKAEALRRVGYLDESLGTCWEDFDMCVRLADAGYRVMTLGKVRVVHLGGKTTGRVSPYITYYNARNRLICLFRHNPWPTLLRRAPRIARTFAWQIRAYGFSNWDCHRAFALGVLDFLRGRRGESPAALRMRRKDGHPE